MEWINVNSMNFPQKDRRKCVWTWWLHLLSLWKLSPLIRKDIFSSPPNHKGFAIKMMQSKDIKITLLELVKSSVSASKLFMKRCKMANLRSMQKWVCLDLKNNSCWFLCEVCHVIVETACECGVTDFGIYDLKNRPVPAHNVTRAAK